MAKLNAVPDSAKLITETYATWGDYRAALAKLNPSERQYSDGEWSGGVNSVGDALALADKGWPEGMSKVHDIAMPALAAVTSVVAPTGHWAWDVTGSDYDVGEFLSGAPECWATPEVESVKPVIRIMACTTSSGMVPAEMLVLRGVGVVALALVLQGAGYAVEVTSVEGAVRPDYEGGEKRAAFTRTMLSDPAGGALDTDRVLFALAHPAACRTLAYNNIDRVTGEYIGGWYPADPPERLGWASDIYLPAAMGGDADWQNPETVIAWVKARLAEVQGR